MHYPDLLILDEPTVGLDPILRQKIWKHLKSLAINHVKTILITTHFVEEASQACKIGFLRNGKLLEDDEPINLLNKYQVDSLEKLFLKLSLLDDRRKKSRLVWTPTVKCKKSDTSYYIAQYIKSKNAKNISFPFDFKFLKFSYL